MSNSRNQTINLPALIRSLLPIAARRFAHRIGMYLAPDVGYTFPNMRNTLLTLKDHGFAPRACVDVGAYKGEWTQMFRKIFPAAKVLMIEPQADKAPTLEALCAQAPGNLHFESAVLDSVSNRDVIFYVMETGSSFLPEITAFPRTQVTLKTKTLDVVLAPRGLDAVDFIKLDTQGAELRVLGGAPLALDQTQAILLEVSLIPYNEGGPLIDEVIHFLCGKDFQLADICGDFRREDHILCQADLLFVRRGSDLFRMLDLDSMRMRKIANL